MHVSDDLYLGYAYPFGISLVPTAGDNPTQQMGVGPAGRIFFLNIVPPTAQTAGFAALQALTAGVAMALVAGLGVTKTVAYDGSGRTAYTTDTITAAATGVARGVSLTSAANVSAVNFTLVGIDFYGRQVTSKIAGPNNNTVNFPKTVAQVISVTPDTTSASTVSVGTADLFGLPYAVKDKTYVVGGPNWNNSYIQDGGTFTVADQTSPATVSTGDTRGTYAPSSASNGTKRLLIGYHLDGTQCGPFAQLVNLLGVTPA